METRLVVSGWGLRSGGKFNSVQEKLEFTFCAYFSSQETLEFVSVYFRFIFFYMKMTENLGENLKKEGIMRCSTTIPISPNNQQIICIFTPFPFHSLSNTNHFLKCSPHCLLWTALITALLKPETQQFILLRAERCIMGENWS